MTALATISAKFVNPPKVEGRSHSVKDATGAYWDFWPNKVKIEAGKTYDVEYTTREYNGKTYKSIQKATEQKPRPAVPNGTPTPFDDRGGVPPHVSNWVAHAITAGLVRSPDQMCDWAQWAYEAGKSMTSRPEPPPEDHQDGPPADDPRFQ